MKTLKDILSQFGYINKPQLAELAEHFPATRVVIKWGAMERERICAWEAAERIEEVESRNQDYCRSVFLSCKETNLLKEAFAIVD
jgi:hypothetical protein|tara:strand:+ start:142 stop:396 length:255 start_codon:yes stop_codon:yes gene_type:complete